MAFDGIPAATGGWPRRGFLGLGVGAGAAALLGTAACGAGGGSAGGSGGAKTLTVACEGGGEIELQPVADKFTKDTGTCQPGRPALRGTVRPARQ